MQARGTGTIALALLSFFAFVPVESAEAQSRQGTRASRPAAAAQPARAAVRPVAARVTTPARSAGVTPRGAVYRSAVYTTSTRLVRGPRGQYRRVTVRGGRWGGLQCVPFARAESGIEIRGNAHTWWSQAAGEYARGYRPESGSVLHFPSNGRMRLGHVAVVKRIVGPREIEIDQANWPVGGRGRGAITRGISVVDVSPLNDWSAVRVEMGRDAEDYGAIYPANGFIYNRPDNGRMVAATATPAPQLALSEPHRDLRPGWQRAAAARYEETAQAVPTSFTIPAGGFVPYTGSGLRR